MLRELNDRLVAPPSWIESDDAGFAVFEKRFLFAPRVTRVKWSEIEEISAFLWDCFSSHAFGFRFRGASGTSVCVDDSQVGWERFRERVLGRFPDLDTSAIATVEAAFPGEAEWRCWTKSSA
jgi:hypothetical protein